MLCMGMDIDVHASIKYEMGTKKIGIWNLGEKVHSHIQYGNEEKSVLL